MEIHLPSLNTRDKTIDEAFRIAVGDLIGNIVPFRGGLLEMPKPVILAGLDYDRPWTRDAAINVWNGASLLMPEVARNTLLSVLKYSEGKVRIGGQYWDAIIWVTGAWWHYLYTGDREFLALAFEAAKNSLEYFEETEFDDQFNLFRGPACYGDGVSAYPDVYASAGGSPQILDWPDANSDKVSKAGFGIPMQSLSTNCLYYHAYVVATKMACELGINASSNWSVKAENMKQAIERHFWIEEKGHYRYLVDSLGNCDYQEGLGNSLILLFNLANQSQAQAVFNNQYVSPAGIPCVWPTFPRYETEDKQSYGRHSGTVWPHVQGFWAHGAAMSGKKEIFSHELFKLAAHACRDSQFTEIYHPLTGIKYGGVQENRDKGISLWPSCNRQTWSATAFLRMILMGLIGMRFEVDGIYFQPCIPEAFSKIQLFNLNYCGSTIDVLIEGNGTKVKKCFINGKASGDILLSIHEVGKKEVRIEM